MFTDPVKVKVNKKEGTVSLSVRTSDFKVEVYTFPRYVFDQLFAQYRALLDDNESN